MISLEKAEHCLARLRLLRFVPADKEARSDLVVILADEIPDDQTADWLVRQLQVRFVEWPGVPPILEIIRERSGKSGPQEWQPTYSHDDAYCAVCIRCRDFGWFQEAGDYHRCTCVEGQRLPEETMERLQSIKHGRLPTHATSLRRVTREDVDRLLAQRSPKVTA